MSLCGAPPRLILIAGMIRMNTYDVMNYPLINTEDGSLGSYQLPYIVFNYLEALCWFGCSMRVLGRYLRHRRTPFEIGYFCSFLMFSISDIIETSGTTPLLLLFKGACILTIIGFRKLILPLYPSNRF